MMSKFAAKVSLADCLDFIAGAPPCDLTLFSPPYPLKDTRYNAATRNRSVTEWVEWQARVIRASVAKTRGDVFVVVNDTVDGGHCLPATALLRANLYMSGIVADRPLIWHKNATPNRNDYFRNDHEYVLCFRGTAGGDGRFYNRGAVELPRKYDSGGKFRQRSNDGGKRTAGGAYPTRETANPGDVIRVTVGGGHMGFDAEDDRLACSGKAPFPYTLAEYIVRAFTRPGMRVRDPFAGSGTTLVAALRMNCVADGCDNDPDAVAIARRRIARVTA